ncbi:hypothetical protein [Dyadobacter jiangsuensis]|uniref:Uncharacterized protein n=1 Tax=Dyadobacter jiangsuensis TaxID=1591085 RepID=A0A2P8FP23_9BACT|nr:hypothetical protein [Dyadobacter jiangsuensis]PSL23481.1 hypothetical protein CLV60_11636 [Dyadobacter jiangsuensis]
MTLKTADRVFETSTTTGTGTLSLGGPVDGFQAFVTGVGSGAKVPYTITQADISGVIVSWECGIGTVTDASPDTLARNTVLKSSNANAPVNFGSGTKNVYLGFIADIVPTRDENLNFIEHFGVVGGTANALTLTLPVAPKAYSDAMTIRGFATQANAAGALQVNVNSLGNKNIKVNGVDPAANVLAVGGYFEAVYKPVSGWFELVYPASGGLLGRLSRSKAPPETSNAADVANDITIAGGVWFATDEGTVIQSVAMTKQQDATWAAGNNAGGMQSGSAKANNQTIDLFAIYNPTTYAVDYKFVPSGTAFVASSGFTERRRIASFKTDATGAIRPYAQRGDEFEYLTPILDVSDASPVTTAVLKTLSVPIGLKLKASVNASITNGNAGGFAALYLSAPDTVDLAPSATVAPLATLQGQDGANSSVVGGEATCWTNTSGQIRTRVAASNSNLYISTLGYFDKRGRDD